jgi:acetyltransferase-like isoleucine patch superfamily enzyme
MDIAPSAWIAGSALIDRTWPRGVHIGPNCVIDEEAVILTHDLTRGLYLDTWIAADAFIGARAIVLPGVSVGRGCIVEPGSLVARDLADGLRASGNPATVVSAMSEI